MRDSFDSRILRWAGFAMAAWIASAFLMTATPAKGHGPRPEPVTSGMASPLPATVPCPRGAG
jgi:hypothetical protein